MNKQNLVIFGAGNVGNEIRHQAEVLGHTVVAQFRSGSVTLGGKLIGSGRSGRVVGGTTTQFSGKDSIEDVDAQMHRICQMHPITFAPLAMPSGGDGGFEAELMKRLVNGGLLPVTAGKAAFANRFAELEDIVDSIGCDAAVGGGIGIIPKLEEDLMVEDPSPIVGQYVTNATLNYILSGRWRRRPMNMLIQEACDLGYAEPESDGGLPTSFRVFTVEIDDVRKKNVILVNRIFRKRIGRILTFEDIKLTQLTEAALASYTAESARYKYVVYLSTEPFESCEIDPTASGSISFDMDGLHIAGGFKHVPADSALDKWLPDGVGNAFEFEQAGNPILASGEGAGRVPTARRVLLNMMRMERDLEMSAESSGISASKVSELFHGRTARA